MIRIAQASDLHRIVEIYNQAVAKKFQTADTEPVTVTDRAAWFAAHENNAFPILVFEADGEVAAWLGISPYRFVGQSLSGCLETSWYYRQN